MLIRLLVGLIWLVSFAEGHSQINFFEKGLAAYEARDFAGASKWFNEAVKQTPSAEAWRNLGNAQWQGELPGPAILAWERALWINPMDADAAASLRFARQSVPAGEMPLRWWEAFSTWLPANAWAWSAAGSFWLAVALAFVWSAILGWRRSAWTQSLAATAFGVFLLTITGVTGIQTRTDLGVVLSPATPLRQTPARHAQILTRLAAGELVRSRYVRGDYFFVCTSAGDSGWLEKSQFQFISRR
jgi:tetratricopeptide (TPR) repeat protein